MRATTTCATATTIPSAHADRGRRFSDGPDEVSATTQGAEQPGSRSVWRSQPPWSEAYSGVGRAAACESGCRTVCLLWLDGVPSAAGVCRCSTLNTGVRWRTVRRHRAGRGQTHATLPQTLRKALSPACCVRTRAANRPDRHRECRLYADLPCAAGIPAAPAYPARGWSAFCGRLGLVCGAVWLRRSPEWCRQWARRWPTDPYAMK